MHDGCKCTETRKTVERKNEGVLSVCLPHKRVLCSQRRSGSFFSENLLSFSSRSHTHRSDETTCFVVTFARKRERHQPPPTHILCRRKVLSFSLFCLSLPLPLCRRPQKRNTGMHALPVFSLLLIPALRSCVCPLLRAVSPWAGAASDPIQFSFSSG